VARDLFMLVLALLTLVAGVALAIMIVRRKRDRRQTTAEGKTGGYGAVRTRRRRLIDDYAAPGAFDVAPKKRPLLDPDAGKICPRCGARYGSHHRFCEHDNSELTALN
jgi:hypothetical protein